MDNAHASARDDTEGGPGNLALHIVEKSYGREVAKKTAVYMDYQGQGWLKLGNADPKCTPARFLARLCNRAANSRIIRKTLADRGRFALSGTTSAEDNALYPRQLENEGFQESRLSLPSDLQANR